VTSTANILNDRSATPEAEARSVARRNRFRPEIQALRAVAVLLVVLNHLWPGRISGGYIGVDIFFVISGYLITSHLRREADSTGRIALGAFWARRAKRLLPASLLVLALSLVATIIWLPVTAWANAVTQIGAAGAYILNWVLASESVNYFTAGSSGTPVTHYWSLSVEEQFYIVWPLIILACFVFSGRLRPQARKRVLVSAFALILVASFCWALFSTATQPSAA
jgi:peptidoglycan/LPS O-acetylase OafA/YrhL